MADINLQAGNPFAGFAPLVQIPQAPAVGQAMLGGGPAMGPPVDENDLNQRVNAWDRFLQALARPEVSRAMINAGTAMLAPRGPGESHGFKIAQGLGVGAATLEQEKDKEFERMTTAQKMKLEERGTAAQERMAGVAERNAGVNERRASTEEKTATAAAEQYEAEIRRINELVRASAIANTPEGQRLQNELTAAEARLRDAQAERLRAQTEAGVLTDSGSIASNVQIANDLALAIAKANGREAPSPEDKVSAYNQIYQGKKKTPSEFWLEGVQEINAAAAKQFPLASFGNAEQQAQQKTWIEGQMAVLQQERAAYEKAISPMTPTTPSQGANPQAATGDPTTNPPQPSGARAVPTTEEIAAYTQYHQQIRARPDYAEQKRKLDLAWKTQFGVPPPQ